MIKTELTLAAIRFSETVADQEVGRAYLYILKNDLHPEPYGLLEDLFVEEEYRNKGVGKKLISALIIEARARGCHKILATSRYARPEVHAWYERLGFVDYGKEFRLNL